ncbi:unnamed protein product [Zymoseptoria tritici ST99CH_1A5]|uniref:Uncharacterized protein n=1 Tax=Zymoseptoria tritici ST99CH_1A5 TaxID=1276529 RepID=A0A1Y6M354_ZYMTR|nr:unnamed protein product [Zymoseptoria tritici ST99CH_1A5]
MASAGSANWQCNFGMRNSDDAVGGVGTFAVPMRRSGDSSPPLVTLAGTSSSIVAGEERIPKPRVEEPDCVDEKEKAGVIEAVLIPKTIGRTMINEQSTSSFAAHGRGDLACLLAVDQRATRELDTGHNFS